MGIVCNPHTTCNGYLFLRYSKLMSLTKAVRLTSKYTVLVLTPFVKKYPAFLILKNCARKWSSIVESFIDEKVAAGCHLNTLFWYCLVFGFNTFGWSHFLPPKCQAKATIFLICCSLLSQVLVGGWNRNI